MKTVFTGIQPTNDLTIANYLALKSFVKQQDHSNCFFSIVNLHAITFPKDPAELLQRTRDLFALYIVAGVDPEKSCLFVQSDVPAHSELSWLITCSSYMGELSRMTQFKDKSSKMKSIPTGVFMYPVLMAADILLYDTDIVPVGADQKQHVEIARDLAERMNNKYGDIFVIPKPEIAKQHEGAKIMALDDPSIKMSKSNPNINSKIGMNYTEKQIKTAISRAVTDSEAVVRYDEKNKPGVSNLMVIHSCFSGLSILEIEKKFEGQGYGAFKKDLTSVVTEEVLKVQGQVADITGSGKIDQLMELGKKKAQERALPVLNRVKKALGLC